jgi:metal-sulfur cluster biosynthetic enzyme
MITIDDVRERLSEIRPPGLKQDIIRAGMVREVKLEGDRVSVDRLRFCARRSKR